jgi:hypothetical protein
LLSVGCNGASGTCQRSEFWDGKEMREEYLNDWIDVFEIDDEGNPTKGLIVHTRANDLEKYCWQTRIKE